MVRWGLRADGGQGIAAGEGGEIFLTIRLNCLARLTALLQTLQCSHIYPYRPHLQTLMGAWAALEGLGSEATENIVSGQRVIRHTEALVGRYRLSQSITLEHLTTRHCLRRHFDYESKRLYSTVTCLKDSQQLTDIITSVVPYLNTHTNGRCAPSSYHIILISKPS